MQSENMARTGQADQTDRLISSEKVDGTAVYNRNGDRLGADLARDRSGHRQVDIRHSDPCAMAGERYRYGTSNSRARARDQAALSCEILSQPWVVGTDRHIRSEEECDGHNQTY